MRAATGRPKTARKPVARPARSKARVKSAPARKKNKNKRRSVSAAPAGKARTRPKKAPGGPPRPPEVYHCSRKGETPQQIADLYGVSLRSLARHSRRIGALLEAERKARRRAAAQKRRRGKRARPVAVPPAVLGAWQRVRVVNPTRRPLERDAVLRIARRASLSWISQQWNTEVALLRCVNDLSDKITMVEAPEVTQKKRRRAQGRRPAHVVHRGWVTVRLLTPEEPSVDRGTPNQGQLRQAERLPEAPGLIVRSPGQAWGTNDTITLLIRAIGRVQRELPDTPPVVVGHLSNRKGGYMVPHKSHQNGWDVDVGYYHTVKVPEDRFTVARPKTLDARRTWALVRALLEDQRTRYIFIDTPLQKRLRAWALHDASNTDAWCRRWLAAFDRARAAHDPPHAARPAPISTARCLDTIFSWPASSSSHQAIVRHSPGHDDHLHVRFTPAD